MAAKPKRFKRRLFGYQRAAVDAHLDRLTDTIDALEQQTAEGRVADHDELVLRATRLSVAAVMEQAEAEAEEIRQLARDAAATVLGDAASAEIDRPSDP